VFVQAKAHANANHSHPRAVYEELDDLSGAEVEAVGSAIMYM
jgi:hypothetical protein